MSIKKKIFAGAVGLIGGLVLTAVVLAAPGNPVPPGTITTIGPSGNCGGIGVAYDGTNILYTCASEPKVRKTDLTGANLGDVSTVDSVTGGPVTLDAIAWDANDGKLWGGDLDGAGNCRIYETDMLTGVATLKFSFVDVHGGCSFSFFDGLTVDKVSNTIWLSPDVHHFIHHYSKAGVEIAADLIDFTTLTAGNCTDVSGNPVDCVNSGLAIGLDGNLFAGTNGFGKIFQLNPGPPATLLGQFATVSGRDEDLECGPVVNGLETILSRDFNNPKIDILEAPAGTCVSPTKEDTRRMTGGGSVFTKAGIRVTHGFELHCDKTKTPNNLEVNWGGNKFHLESLDKAACSDDPAIIPNPPVAGFDTYKGEGTGRYNGVSGYKAKWVFTDAGEPGKNDTANIVITDSSGIITVLSVSGNLKVGNQQAHNN